MTTLRRKISQTGFYRKSQTAGVSVLVAFLMDGCNSVHKLTETHEAVVHARAQTESVSAFPGVEECPLNAGELNQCLSVSKLAAGSNNGSGLTGDEKALLPDGLIPAKFEFVVRVLDSSGEENATPDNFIEESVQSVNDRLFKNIHFKFTYRESPRSPDKQAPDKAPFNKQSDPIQRAEAVEMPISLTIGPANLSNAYGYRQGDEVEFSISSSTDLYAQCFYQQFDGSVYKIFPNKFNRNNLISAGKTVALPSTKSVLIRADSPGPVEKIQCMASESDSTDDLPNNLRDLSLNRLPYTSIKQVQDVFNEINGNTIFSQVYFINVIDR